MNKKYLIELKEINNEAKRKESEDNKEEQKVCRRKLRKRGRSTSNSPEETIQVSKNKRDMKRIQKGKKIKITR